jgi:hypothetical protein
LECCTRILITIHPFYTVGGSNSNSSWCLHKDNVEVSGRISDMSTFEESRLIKPVDRAPEQDFNISCYVEDPEGLSPMESSLPQKVVDRFQYEIQQNFKEFLREKDTKLCMDVLPSYSCKTRPWSSLSSVSYASEECKSPALFTDTISSGGTLNVQTLEIIDVLEGVGIVQSEHQPEKLV